MTPKPKIAIDTSYMDRRPGKGTATVIKHSIEELLRYREEFDITLIHRIAVPEDPRYRDFKEIIIPRIPLPRWSGFFSELWFFLTTKERFDVYYFSYSRIYPTFWLAPAKRIVFAIMDGGPASANYKAKIKGKQPFSVRIFFNKIHAFVALSEFGRRGAIQSYGLPPEKVHIVYNGVDAVFKPPTDQAQAAAHLKEAYGITAPYILCVSRFDPHKNILRLLEAYRECVDADPSTEKLVFVGGRHMPDYSREVDERIAALALTDRIFVAPYIETVDLPSVYALSELTVFPSMYEGFGFPAVEAMASGAPLLVSDIDALREVSDGHAELVDPYDVHSIAQGIQNVRANATLRAERAAAGLISVQRFTWKAHGDALAGVLRKAADTV